MINRSKNSRRMINGAFFLFCLSLLLFLYLAPEETTSQLPDDGVHEKFRLVKSKKEADRLCLECHYDQGTAPLPQSHPPPYRCLFCHKRD